MCVTDRHDMTLAFKVALTLIQSIKHAQNWLSVQQRWPWRQVFTVYLWKIFYIQNVQLYLVTEDFDLTVGSADWLRIFNVLERVDLDMEWKALQM